MVRLHRMEQVMRKAFALFEIVPALVFAGLALFVLARLAIGAYPADPLAWQAYLMLEIGRAHV